MHEFDHFSEDAISAQAQAQAFFDLGLKQLNLVSVTQRVNETSLHAFKPEILDVDS